MNNKSVADYSDRIRSLLSYAVAGAVRGKETAVAFSGGVDSGLLTVMAKENADKVRLYTVGKEGSYDVVKSRRAADELGLDMEHIELSERNMEPILREMIQITGTRDTVTLSFEVPTFCVTKHSDEKDILDGIGADELFAGYHKYIGLAEQEFIEMRDEDLDRLMSFVIRHEDKAAGYFGKTIHRPFLDAELVRTALSLPFREIEPRDEDSRKGILKKIASDMGYGIFADTTKKAAQYGSGAMDIMKAISKKNGMSVSEYVRQLCKEELD